jgi:hypothetical protein
LSIIIKSDGGQGRLQGQHPERGVAAEQAAEVRVLYSFLRSRQEKVTIDEVLAFSDQLQSDYMELFPCEQQLELKEFIDSLLLKQLYEK